MQNPSKSVREQAEQFVTGSQLVVTGYTSGGHEIDPNSSDCFAKKSEDEAIKSTRFFVKKATTGPEAGSFYNPNSASFGHVIVGGRFVGRGLYEFRPVNQEAFNLYLQFLRTGNTAYARCAERV